MKWISTLDELPLVGEEVLVKVRYPNPTTYFVTRFEGHNNLVPYAWRGPGPYTFFGQDITHWMRIPE